MYDGLGEFRQGVTWKSNIVSRARLFAAYAPDRPGDEPQPIPADAEDPATDIVQRIAGGIGGQSELLRTMTVHLDVPGEGWFVAEAPDIEEQELAWTVYAADEVRREKRGRTVEYFIRTGSSQWRSLPESAVPVRVWRPHDRHHWQADSSARAALPIMRRLELLNRHVDAQATSRLAMNGVYWIASEISFPPNSRYPDADDPFIAEFMDNGITAIKTPGSAAASFPIVNRAPFQYIKEGIRYDTFSSPFDQKVLELREFEVRRLATAMDVPPEVLLGMAGLSHWSAWQVEESALKTTVTSTLELICWALTKSYLRPALDATNARRPFDRSDDERAPRRIVWYDTSELSVRPDRSQDAITLARHLMLNNDALMRETGFDNADLLSDPEELKQAIARRLVEVGTPTAVATAVQLLGLASVDQVNNVPVVVNERGEPRTGLPDSLPVTNVPPANPNGERPALPNNDGRAPRTGQDDRPTTTPRSPRRAGVN